MNDSIKTEKEDTLSKKRIEKEKGGVFDKGIRYFVYSEEDVKEFIKRLKKVGKERLKHLPSDNYELFCEDIDELAGKELI